MLSPSPPIIMRTYSRTIGIVVVLLLAVSAGTSAGQGQERDDREGPTVAGTVLDPSGAAVVAAQVTLTFTDGTQARTATSGLDGRFMFVHVAPGSHVVTVQAQGFAPVATRPFTVTPSGGLTLPPIALSIEDVTASVTVRPIEAIAEEQIRAQEKQRLFGFVPNFYVSYIPDAAPLASRQKLSLASRHTFDWTSFAGATVSAGVQQAVDAHSGYGRGASGYAKRWAASFATERSNDLLSHYVFASLFHQDPRYFYQGTGTTRSRLGHALSYAFAARSDSGKAMPNYAYLLGGMGAAGLSNLYYPHEERGAGLIFTNAALGFVGRAGQAVVQEFVARRVTTNVRGPRPSGAP
jgi:carboxypeptidase family protein